jgi:hypothetical protein
MNNAIVINEAPKGFPVQTNHTDYLKLNSDMTLAGRFQLYPLKVQKSNLGYAVSAYLIADTASTTEKTLFYLIAEEKPDVVSRICLQKTPKMDEEQSRLLVYAALDKLHIDYKPSSQAFRYFLGG